MGGQGPGDFQSLPLRKAQGMGHVMSERGDSGPFKDLIDLAIRFGSRTAVQFSEDRGGLDVFKDGHFEKRADHLKGAGYPEMTQAVRPHSGNRRIHESYFSVGRVEEPAENRKERRLSRAIRSDHADNLSGSNLKRYPGKSLQSPEGPGKVLHPKQQRLEGSRIIMQRIIHELTFL